MRGQTFAVAPGHVDQRSMQAQLRLGRKSEEVAGADF